MSDKKPEDFGWAGTLLPETINPLRPACTDATLVPLEALSRAGSHHPSLFSLSAGSLMLFMAVLLKVDVHGFKLGTLSSHEFIAMISAGALLLISEGLLGLYQSKKLCESVREAQDFQLGLLNRIPKIVGAKTKDGATQVQNSTGT